MTGEVGTETSTATVKTLTPIPSSSRRRKKVRRLLHVRVFVCAHVHSEAVIEKFVCASDGATGWQDGGPSLTGKTQQEEQTLY